MSVSRASPCVYSPGLVLSSQSGSFLESLVFDFMSLTFSVGLSTGGIVIENLRVSYSYVSFGHKAPFFNRFVCFTSSRLSLMLLVCSCPFALVPIADGGLFMDIFIFYLYFDFLGHFKEIRGEVSLETCSSHHIT